MFASPNTRPSVVESLKREGIFKDVALTEDSPTTSDADGTSDVEAGNVRKSAKAPKSPALLGTLSGVFLPCLQNILGVILFLRLPFITAQAGCIQTTAIILICAASTFITSLSLSAIASNGRIQGGGPYYVISRTLGKEMGGSLGILFYLGTTIAASMYVLGAVEAIQTGFNLNGMFTFDTQTEALILMLIIATTVAVGVQYVNRASVVFLGIVLVSIFCLSLGAILFATGAFSGELPASARKFGDNLLPQFSTDPDTGKTPSFLSLLALFYPSVTGIMAGSNRSAVLKDPSRSIPIGTLSAVGVTTSIYIAVVWLFGSVLSHEALIEDKLIVTAVAWPAGIVVRIGIIMSSVGAALQCTAGAPRLLAAIASDDCIGFLRYVKPASQSSNPTRAVFATYIIASIPCLAGNLDVITPIITLFFLLMYCGINLSCFLLGILKAPSFRPTFRYCHWGPSLFGALWCLALAFTMSYLVALGAIALMIFLFVYILRSNKSGGSDYGDIVQGIKYAATHGLLKNMCDIDEVHAKNWRPQLLMIVQSDEHGVISESGSCLVRLCASLSKGRGMNMVVAVMPGSNLDPESKEAAKHVTLELQRQYSIEGLEAFPPEVALSPSATNISDTISLLVRHSGIGPLRPNAILLSWPQNGRSDGGSENKRDVVASLQHVIEAKKTILVLKGNQSFPGDFNRVKHESIDVWWLCHDGGLLLLLPFLLSRNAVWKGAKLRLFAGVTSIVRDLDRFRDAILEHLQKARIEADVQVVDLSHLQDTVAVEAPAVHSDVDDDTVEGTLLYQIFSPHKDSSSGAGRPPTGANKKKMESSLDRSPDTSSSTTMEQATPRQRLVFGGADDHDDGDDMYAHTPSSSTQSAVALNHVIRSRSGEGCRLVVTNLPLLKPTTRRDDFTDYIDALCRGLDNVLLERGAGNEVITQYA